MKDYNELLQQRVDKSFNYILAIGSVIAFIASYILFIADLPYYYAILNFSTALILLLFYIFSNKIKTSYKIILMVVVTLIISVASFLGGSFYSSFSVLLILSNVIAVLFLNQRTSVIISACSTGLMFTLCYYSVAIIRDSAIKDPLLIWGLQIVAYILFLVVLQISVYAIKNYLMENIEGLEKSIKYANQLAYYDQLTHLPNLNKFTLEVNERISKYKKDGFLVILKLKSLSLINFTLGRDVGDQTLVEAAVILNNLSIENSIVARIGGNEFAVWIDDISEDNLHYYFDYILSELKTQSIILKKKLDFFASYSNFQCCTDTLEVCYQRAALTLIYAKEKDILNLVAYDDKLGKILRRNETIKDLIENALVKEEFTLFYQAKHDSRTNRVVGVEGLARWNSSKLGFVYPSEFIPIIESLNMSIEFGNFVIKRACMDFARLQKKYNEDLEFSINISPSHLMNADIVQVMKESLEKYNIPRNRLTIEITEDIIIKGIENVKSILKELKALDVKISLDDFGTGYSSLNYLTQLEIDEIKIDKSFVEQIGYNDNIHILLDHIINISEQFELGLVAEGVETHTQKEVLSKLGCYILQGYYYAKPELL